MKTAVVTGGGGILCGSFALELARHGWHVAVLDRSLEAAQDVADKIIAEGGSAVAMYADVLDKECLIKVREQLRADGCECSLLVNGAGGNSPAATCDDEFFDADVFAADDKKSFFDLGDESFRRVFGLNIVGVVLPTQVFAEDMVKAGSGCIINVSSMNAYTPLTKIPAYSSAKAAVSNLTQWLAVYFAKTGIRVNAIAPGFFSTHQNKALLWNEDGTPTARSEKILRNTPMGRFGEPEELLGTLMWLSDDKTSGFVTGIVVPVDGGFSAYSGV